MTAARKNVNVSPIKNNLILAGYFSYRVSENQGKLTNHIINEE